MVSFLILTAMLRAGERGYACGAGRVHVKRVAALLAVIADLEPEILRRRARRDAQSSSKKPERSDAKKDALVEMAARACGRFDALSLQDDDDRREPTPQEALSTKHLAERAVQKHAERLLKDSDLNDPCMGQKGFRERYYRKVLKHGPPAIPPHGERSGAELVRSLQDTLSALSVSQSRSVS